MHTHLSFANRTIFSSTLACYTSSCKLGRREQLPQAPSHPFLRVSKLCPLRPKLLRELARSGSAGALIFQIVGDGLELVQKRRIDAPKSGREPCAGPSPQRGAPTRPPNSLGQPVSHRLSAEGHHRARVTWSSATAGTWLTAD
jgi:hypothetical protein